MLRRGDLLCNAMKGVRMGMEDEILRSGDRLRKVALPVECWAGKSVNSSDCRNRPIGMLYLRGYDLILKTKNI